MRQLLLLLVVVAAAVAVGLAWAFKNLPWWQTVALVVGLLVVAKLAAARLFTWALSIPFKWKGAVLRGATVQVHSITPAAPPSKMPEADGASDSESKQESSARDHFLLDVTVTPNAPPGKFTQWGPNEVQLVKPESRVRLHGASDEDDACEVKRIEVEDEGQFKEDEGFAYAGPRRLKLLLAVQPGTSRLKFRYYFEEFGELQLPTNSSFNATAPAERAA